MEKEKEKKNEMVKRMGKKLAILALALAVCFGAGMLAGVTARRDHQPEITADLINNRIEEISQLVSVEYHYTRMGKYEDRIDFYGWQVPLTMKRFIISYDGVIWAGVDLKQAEIEIKKDGSVQVTLPQARVVAHEQDLESIQVFDETKNIFNPIQITDYIEFSKDQKQGAEQDAIDRGLLVQAQERAENVVTEWLTTLLNSTGATPQITVISTEIADGE